MPCVDPRLPVHVRPETYRAMLGVHALWRQLTGPRCRIDLMYREAYRTMEAKLKARLARQGIDPSAPTKRSNGSTKPNRRPPKRYE